MNDEYNLNKLIMRGRHLTDKTSGSRLVFTNSSQLSQSVVILSSAIACEKKVKHFRKKQVKVQKEKENG